MIKELLLTLRGKAMFTIDVANKTSLANALLRCPLDHTHPKETGGGIVFATTLRDRAAMAAFLEQADIGFSVKDKGLPPFALRYRRRIGLLVGFFLFSALLTLSTLFLWSVEVEGNTLLTDEEVLAELADAGFGVGSFLPTADYDTVNHRLLLASEDIAWLGIEVRGTHAVVSVRERVKKKAGAARAVKAANLVSNTDGQIFYTTVYHGTTVVNAGDSVKKGDLLVSGFCESEDGSFTLGRASGKVFAYVTRTITVDVPFEQAEKVETGEKKETIYVNIFGKSIKLFQKGRKTPAKYDIMKDKHTVTVFDTVKLPLSFSTLSEVGYEYRIRTLTKSEAMEEAENRFEQKISRLSNGFDFVELSRTASESEDGVSITALLYGVENIAELREIVTEQP